MAIENKYANALQEAGQMIPAGFYGNGEPHKAVALVSIAAADDDGSVYRLFQVPSSAVITQLQVNNSAITGGSDYDIGIYSQDKGLVVDADLLADGISVVAARNGDAANNVGLTSVALADRQKSLGELQAVEATPDNAYEIAITANTVGTVAGTIVVTLEYVTV